MKSVSILLVFLHFISINEILCLDTKGMSFIGYAIEAFVPCLDRFIYMEREIGHPPAIENYWDGSINLSGIKNLTNAKIILQLTHPATLTVNETNASVRTSDNQTFFLEAFDPKNNLKITVLGGQGKPYPNIANVSLNGNVVCENPAQIQPTMIGPSPMASSLKKFVPNCGRRKIEQTTLTIQGNNTKPGEWPWHVAIYLISGNNETTLKYQCGGTIINNNTVITAAQCVVNDNNVTFPSEKLKVVVGKYHMNTQDKWIQQRDVASIKINKGFSRSTLRNDIAIIRVKNHFNFDEYVQPICLWTDYEADRDTSKHSAIGLNGTIVGWGNEYEVASETLMKSNLQIISDEKCLTNNRNFYQKFINIKSFCADSTVKDRSLCNGYRGDGLVIPIRQVDNEYSYFLRGIISVSASSENERICDPTFYKVFTDAAQFVKWIKNN